MIVFRKIKAAALQYVLVISVLIGIILFAFISLVYLQQKLVVKYGFSDQSITNVQNAFRFIKVNTIEYDKQLSLEFLEDQNSTTTLIKRHWGVFDRVTASSKVKNEYFQRSALVGYQNKNLKALYVKDNFNSLVVVGNTKIEGDVMLPRQGIKPGNISGVSFYGRELIFGKQLTSGDSLPIINNKKYLKEFMEQGPMVSVKRMGWTPNMKLYQEFSKESIFIEGGGNIILDQVELGGNIIVQSNQKITVRAGASLENIILMAPRIEIEKQVEGSFQAIASEQIIVGKNCKLSYPSALVVYKLEDEKNKAQEASIEIRQGTQFRGVIVYLSDDNKGNYNSQVRIGKDVLVKGEIYCDKNLTLEGNVQGMVTTNNFILPTPGGTYLNHLLDVEINANKLNEQYAGLLIGGQSNQVMKWLD